MSKRRTYTERRSYSARVMRWRLGVYRKRAGLTNGCRVLLLRLSDDMDAKCIVSVPRAQMAEEFDVAPARISEWIAQARGLGFLNVVKRAQPGTTAVYQGLNPTFEVRQGITIIQDPEVRKTVPGGEVRQGVPQNPNNGTGTAGTHEGTNTRDIQRALEQSPFEQERSKERGCFYCGNPTCDGECAETQEETTTTNNGRWTA